MFTLYGGTALALRLGHRTSVDFDFFSNTSFDPDRLAEQIPYLKGAERVQLSPNTLTCRVNRGGPVLLSYFGGLGLGQVAAPEQVQDLSLQVASLLDLAGTKQRLCRSGRRLRITSTLMPSCATALIYPCCWQRAQLSTVAHSIR